MLYLEEPDLGMINIITFEHFIEDKIILLCDCAFWTTDIEFEIKPKITAGDFEPNIWVEILIRG
jgi:hypothetical protein